MPTTPQERRSPEERVSRLVIKADVVDVRTEVSDAEVRIAEADAEVRIAEAQADSQARVAEADSKARVADSQARVAEADSKARVAEAQNTTWRRVVDVASLISAIISILFFLGSLFG